MSEDSPKLAPSCDSAKVQDGMAWARRRLARRSELRRPGRVRGGSVPGPSPSTTLNVLGPLAGCRCRGLPRTDHFRVQHLPEAICRGSELLFDTHVSRHGGGFLPSMLTAAAGGEQRAAAREERCCFYVYSYLVDEQETDT